MNKEIKWEKDFKSIDEIEEEDIPTFEMRTFKIICPKCKEEVEIKLPM